MYSFHQPQIRSPKEGLTNLSNPVSLGGLSVRRTSQIINADTRLCALVQARPKFGKTTLGGTLHYASEKFFGKPGIVIAVEASDGGGVSSIQDFDMPFVQPATYQELDRLIAALATDTTYGAVILDNATDMVSRLLKPHALTFPVRGAPPATRSIGVPCRDDYQTMGELSRKVLNSLINLTKLPNINARKHLLVTVLEKEKQDDGTVVAVCPDLPGAMADCASAMFELYAGIKVGNIVKSDPNNPKNTIRESVRLLTTKGDGKKQLGDRYKVFPEEGPLDFVQLFDQYWMPKVAATQAAIANA